MLTRWPRAGQVNICEMIVENSTDTNRERVNMDEPEVRYWYPPEWRDEFLRTGTVKIWGDHYPELGDGSLGIHKPSPKNESSLSTYALMYLLRRDEGVHSLTYFRLPAKTPTKDGRREQLQAIMRNKMDDKHFDTLRNAIRAAHLTKQGFQGEPDLFCWQPITDTWFFAEAKGKDTLTASQHQWFRVCRETLPGVVIRVCKVRPQTKTATK